MSEVQIPIAWTSLYAVSELPVGAALIVDVLAGGVQAAISATAPSAYDVVADAGGVIQIDGGQAGAWMRGVGGPALVSVRLANSSIRSMPFSDPRVIDGLKAVTVQSFSELNAKTGRQYEAAFHTSALAAGASVDFAFIVGSERVLIKDMILQFDSVEFSIQTFRAPTYTGGTEIIPHNLNDGAAVADDVTLLAGVTTSNVGTPVSPAIYTLGSSSVGNRAQSSVPHGIGIDRIFAANTTYLYRLTNTDPDNPARVAGLLTWYQGPLSVDVP